MTAWQKNHFLAYHENKNSCDWDSHTHFWFSAAVKTSKHYVILIQLIHFQVVSDILRDADEADEDFYVGELGSRLNSDNYNDDLVVAELRARLPKVNTFYIFT